MGKTKPASRSIKKIPLAEIATEGGTQTRAGINEATVTDYRELYAEGVTLPEPVVFFDGETYWLSSGFHRVEAAKREGYDSIACEVQHGGAYEAFIAGLSANAAHGLPRTIADKRHAVQQALKKPTLADKSDREIARLCCVSHTLVAEVRRGNVASKPKPAVNDSAPVPEFDDSDGIAESKRLSDTAFVTIDKGNFSGSVPVDAGGIVCKPLTLSEMAHRPSDPGAPIHCDKCNGRGAYLPGEAFKTGAA